MRRRFALLALAAGALVLTPTAASAHPLGNFTVNHADALLLTPDAVLLTAVVDRAEIPTAQLLQHLAPDGTPDADQLASAASAQCADLVADLRMTVDGATAEWTTRRTTLEVVPGAAGLPTLRLTCELRADADLRGPARLAFGDHHLGGTVGWREITADGDGVRLVGSPVPVSSPTDQLRAYPVDLLASPLDVRSVELDTGPGRNTGAGAASLGPAGDPVSSAMAALDGRLQGLVGEGRMTPVVGLLAVVLAVLLGCGHALLPGHGKTVMAAYLAGRRGRPRDAVVVGATVTATHTAGVLLLGVAISVSSTLAGDQLLRWLGVASGLLVAGIGGFLLRAALGAGRAPRAAVDRLPDRALALAGAVHDHGDGHAHAHPHVHGAEHAHEHGAHHDHHHDHPHDGWLSGGHDHGPGRGGLVGMGVAGGLVPSPSALIVLLASVGLGRTVFGVLLVLAYGLGMAATLTGVGLALVRLRDRLDRRLDAGRAPALVALLARTAPVLTAVLVLLVGLAMAARGLLLA
jgi:ABC-type nickel/cobalt efflux system permease component RcnA